MFSHCCRQWHKVHFILDEKWVLKALFDAGVVLMLGSLWAFFSSVHPIISYMTSLQHEKKGNGHHPDNLHQIILIAHPLHCVQLGRAGLYHCLVCNLTVHVNVQLILFVAATLPSIIMQGLPYVVTWLLHTSLTSWTCFFRKKGRIFQVFCDF